jgi:hypothetical protein
MPFRSLVIWKQAEVSCARILFVRERCPAVHRLDPSRSTRAQRRCCGLVGTALSEIQFCSFCLHGSFLRIVGFCVLHSGNLLHKKQMPFMAREGDWPPAPSRAPGCGVHRSEAKTLYRRSGRIRRSVWSGRAGLALWGESARKVRGRLRKNSNSRFFLEMFCS